MMIFIYIFAINKLAGGRSQPDGAASLIVLLSSRVGSLVENGSIIITFGVEMRMFSVIYVAITINPPLMTISNLI